MNEKINTQNKLTIKGYFNLVIENIIRSFKREENTRIYRIGKCNNLQLDDVSKIDLVIEIIGKSEYFHITPKDLYKDDCLINGFSSIETRTITALGLLQEGRYKITDLELQSIRFGLEGQTAIFLEKCKGKTIEKNIKELPNCDKLLERLSPMEAFRLGMSYENETS